MKEAPPVHDNLEKPVRLAAGVLVAAFSVLGVVVHFARLYAETTLGVLLACGGTAVALAGIGSALWISGRALKLARSMDEAVAHLVEVARAVMHGHTRRRAVPESTGKLLPIAQAFNRMIEARQEAEDRIKTSNESLELRVHARTAELWRANKALQEESEQRARTEREFQQAQKMDALGKLAGSIAHDFNNLLTVIIGGIECAQDLLPRGHSALNLLDTSQKAAERAAALTRPLLTFSRSQLLAVEVVDLNEAAKEASHLLKRLLGVNIELRLNLSPDLLPLKANANQIQQVLMNLGVNARDAMSGMGLLTISTKRAAVDSEAILTHGATPAEDWLELAVSDSGCGMDAETKARIFEPFFTTKPVGSGTGLGLATVFGIVKQTGGFVEVESALGQGTTFRVFLPAASEMDLRAAAEVPEPSPVAIATGGNEMILIVDDEEDIRELAGFTLEAKGYRVLSAGSAEEAIVLAEQHRDEIKVLVTDVVMPGMNGTQLAEVLSAKMPDLRILFVSGHSTETISAESLVAAHATFLQKPYRGEMLAGKIGEILAGSGQGELATAGYPDFTPWVE